MILHTLLTVSNSKNVVKSGCFKNICDEEHQYFSKKIGGYQISYVKILTTPYSVRIQESTDQKKLRIWTLFTLCNICQLY